MENCCVNGIWYDGKTSAQTAAVLKISRDGDLQIQSADGAAILHRQARFNGRVSDRLADTPRLIAFPDGCVFETDDNQGIDRLLTRISGTHWSQWVHRLESKIAYVMVALAIVVLIGYGMVTCGVPWAAKLVAGHLPATVFQMADRQTLGLLDRAVFQASELTPEIEARVRTHLRPLMEDHPDLGLHLIFRQGGALGPNAFALPGGTIVFTDELIEMAKRDEELFAVLAHEIGHVAHQHGMRRMVQDALLSFAAMAITGDASGVSELFLGLPVVLTELAYSRDFESQADDYAMARLMEHRVAPHYFADILSRIDKRHEQASQDGKSPWTGYLATHPPTSERMRAFLENESSPDESKQ